MAGEAGPDVPSKWWAVPYVLGIGVLAYLVLGTRVGARIYGGISLALMVWFFVVTVYALIHLLWLRLRRRRSATS